APAAPSVGDTIWIVRAIAAPPGWRVRPDPLEPGEAVTPLGEPAVARGPEGWVIRYPVAIWRPGITRLVLPPVWRFGPDARAAPAAPSRAPPPAPAARGGARRGGTARGRGGVAAAAAAGPRGPGDRR